MENVQKTKRLFVSAFGGNTSRSFLVWGLSAAMFINLAPMKAGAAVGQRNFGTQMVSQTKNVTGRSISQSNEPLILVDGVTVNSLNDIPSDQVESIFEIGNMQGGQSGQTTSSEYSYSFGRPSGGGSNQAAPCKSFGALRIIPSFYYGDFEQGDMRRDASVTVTGSKGDGNETLLSFNPGNKLDGGIAINKWDENRMNPPYTASQRLSGMNRPVLRLADLILMQAEVKAELGAEGEAIQLVNQIRQRAFGNTNYAVSASGEALKEAVLQERKLELLGEGTRRWDLIRSGKFVEKALAVREEMAEMVNDLQTKGYHEFANGNVISNYIYTKNAHLSSPLTFDPDESDPALYPGWRGQYDYSTTPVKVTGTDHNLAIKGLFNYIDPNGAEAKKLLDEGDSKADWGSTLVKYADHYTNSNLLPGVKEGNVPPRYYWSIPFETLSKSKSKITNGYGLAQE